MILTGTPNAEENLSINPAAASATLSDEQSAPLRELIPLGNATTGLLVPAYYTAMWLFPCLIGSEVSYTMDLFGDTSGPGNTAVPTSPSARETVGNPWTGSISWGTTLLPKQPVIIICHGPWQCGH